MSRGNKPPGKDMYWFAHGGAESDKNPMQRSLIEGEEEVHGSNSPTWNTLERKGSPEELKVSIGSSHTDGGSNSSGPASLEREDRLRAFDKRIAVEERKKQIWEAEQERNDAAAKKRLEREAALEARRNAQKSTITFAFGSSVPRNVDTLHANGEEFESMSRSLTASGLSQREENHDSFHDRRSVSPLNYSGHTLLVDDLYHRPISSQSCAYSERKTMPPSSWLFGSGALIGEDVMSRSMNAAMLSAPRGRRKNDLMPTVPYERTPTPRAATSSSTRKRSVSMTRLDQLAQPRRHYVEANKASSTASSGASSMVKDNIKSPTRPLSSASEHSGGSGRIPSTVTRRVRSSPRKPRPISIAGTIPDLKPVSNAKPFEARLSPVKRSYTPSQRVTENSETKKTGLSSAKSSTPKPLEKVKLAPRPTTAPRSTTPKSKPSESKPPGPKAGLVPKTTPAPKTPTVSKTPTTPKTPVTPKGKEKKTPQPTKKKTDVVVASPLTAEVNEKADVVEKLRESPSPPLENDVTGENDKNNAKRIISEEEARAALAEKRRLAREQAEREAELERQRQEALKREEEERLRQEEEEHRKMEEEQNRLLEEHRRQEDEKLRKAIEDQEQKEEDERAKRDEEIRLKAEQEKKAKEEAEKQRLELEEKLRKEEEERAERKKRLEKIMSRTRGKSSGTSPSGSVSGSDQLDSGENPNEGFSSGANSLDSNETGEHPSEPVSIDDHPTKAEVSSTCDSVSMENNPTYEIGSENESLNSNDMMMPASETASQDNSLVIIPDKSGQSEEASTEADSSSTATPAAMEEENVAATSSPKISVNEEISASVSSLSTEVLAAAVPESADLLPVESQTLKQEDGMTESLLPGSDEPDAIAAQFGNQDLMSEVLQQGLEAEELVLGEMQKPVEEATHEDSGNAEINVQSSESPKLEESLQYIRESTESKVESSECTVTQSMPSDNAEQDSALLYQPSNLTDDHLKIENISAVEGNDAGYTADAEYTEMSALSSISSDIKLPDPIYETSDEGSVSSEKQLHEIKSASHLEELSYTRNAAVMDDVFSEQSNPMNQEFSQQNLFGAPGFSDQPNPFAGVATENDLNLQKTELEGTSTFGIHFDGTSQHGTSENAFGEKETFILPDVLDQPPELEGEYALPSGYTSSSANEYEGEYKDEVQHFNDDRFISQFNDHANKEDNVNPFSQNSEGRNAFSDQFSSDEVRALEAYDRNLDQENTFSVPTTVDSGEIRPSEDSQSNFGTGDNPFVAKSPSDTPFSHNFEPEKGDSNHVGPATESEQISDFKDLLDGGRSSEPEKLTDVTLISDDGSGACIGIISSVDHDHVSNNFPKTDLRSEQLKNNFVCASLTDSEDSSLDSVLSQVMTAENSEKDTTEGLNHVGNSILESNSSNLVRSNGDNPFETEHIYNHGSISKSNGSSLLAPEVYSNGHGFESSKAEQLGELHDYPQLDGNDILSVDHSKNNMYESVDAIDFSKASSDPFLEKGNSKQISGNPFLLQDDQKQVLMTPDFLN